MTHDPVNNPSHYNQNGIEVIDVIETYAKDDFRIANVIKYVCRHSYKGKPLEDLRKARWYLERVIKEMEREEKFAEDYAAHVEHYNNLPDTFVVPTPDRIAGDTAPAIKALYYDYDPEFFIDNCDWCNETIKKGTVYIMDNDDNVWCSAKCREEDIDFRVGGTE